MISQLFYQHLLTHFLSKDMNLLVKPLRNQFLGLFCGLSYFFLFISNFLFFYYLLYLYCPLLFQSFFLFSASSLLFFSFLLFISAILISSVLVSTAYYTPLNILSSLLLLFSSQFQDCGEQAIAFLRLYLSEL